MIKKYDFNPDDFKKWMESTKEEDVKAESKEVESKITYKKLLAKAELEDGVLEEVCHDFIHDGGIVLETNDKVHLIKVASGTFHLSAKYVD